MNKKIWIGFLSIFLVLVLVLGMQMLNEKTILGDQSEIDNKVSSQEEPLEVITPEIYQELDEPETQDIVEIPEESETPDKSEDPVETKETPKTSEEAVETSKADEPSLKEEDGLYISLLVSVETLVDKKDLMNPEKWGLVPEDGLIFSEEKVEFFEGESAFNVLLREMKKNKIHMEFVMTPIYNSNYIQGIGNLYEFDCGELSGWMYAVNDLSPNFGTSDYILKDGDNVKLLYTCDLGRDLGFEFDE